MYPIGQSETLASAENRFRAIVCEFKSQPPHEFPLRVFLVQVGFERALTIKQMTGNHKYYAPCRSRLHFLHQRPHTRHHQRRAPAQSGQHPSQQARTLGKPPSMVGNRPRVYPLTAFNPNCSLEIFRRHNVRRPRCVRAHMEVNQALCFLGIDSISRFGSSVLEFVFHALQSSTT